MVAPDVGLFVDVASPTTVGVFVVAAFPVVGDEVVLESVKPVDGEAVVWAASVDPDDGWFVKAPPPADGEDVVSDSSVEATVGALEATAIVGSEEDVIPPAVGSILSALATDGAGVPAG